MLVSRDMNITSSYTWLDKAFSRMETDSFRSSLLLMIVSSIGIGLMFFHQTFNKIGIINGLILTILVSFVFMHASDILIYSLRFSSNIKSISEVVESILGR